MIWAIFAFPFLQLKVKVLLGFISSTKPDVLDFDLRMGFVEEKRIEGAVPGGDMVILSMRQEGYRWLKGPAPKGFLRASS